MRAGEFADGSRTLRAKIDMASPNINLRDPVMYRVLRATHHRTGDQWCIYPTYDFAHGQSDSIEGITHSICTLEFEDHRPLYDWFLDQIGRSSSAADRIRPAQSHLHGTEQAQTAATGPAKTCEPAGTIRACRPWPASAGAAIRRKRFATFASASAWPNATAPSISPCSNTACARI